MISPLDNYLLRAYLDDALDEAETDAFELLLIERPELAELVIADVALELGLKAEADSGLLPPALVRAAPASAPDAAVAVQTTAADEISPQSATVAPLRSGQPPAQETAQATTGAAQSAVHPRPRERRRNAAPYLAAAAALLALGLGIGTWLQPGQPMLRRTEVAVADTLRGSSLRQIRLPPSGELTLSVPAILPPDCAPPLLLSLAQSGQRWEITPDAPVDDYVHVGVDARRLQPGKAEIQLSCAGKPLQTTGIEFTR